jgi:2-methylcitrate dehydratase PrpD
MQSTGNRFTRRVLAQAAVAGATALSARGQAKAAGPESTGVTRRICEFIVNTRYADLPKDVLDLGKKSILDGLGLALVGSVAKSGQIVRSYLESLGMSHGDATVVGSAMKCPVGFAAFANGIGIHADDYDDTQLSAAPDRVYGLLTHPTAPCLSAALAVAETRRMSGRDLMLAYHLGVEVESKISEAIAPRHYQDGFHSTGTCGTFASAAAAMKLYGADAAACARAMGVAASQSAGLRENFGTMTKPLHMGRAAENGVFAAELAARGFEEVRPPTDEPWGERLAYFRDPDGHLVHVTARL